MLSLKQQRIFNFVAGYIASNREAPTIAEIQRQFQLSSTATVHQHLENLEREGLIKRTPNVSRGIRLSKNLTAPSQAPEV